MVKGGCNCQYLNDKDDEEKGNNSVLTPASSSGYWIKLLNVDKTDSPNPVEVRRSSNFEKDWAKERTYTRWEHFGSLYGFSYHSGVLLSDICGEPPVSHIFRCHYLDMILLLLYLRLTVFNFSQQLNDLSIKVRKGHNKNWEKDFRKLRKQFAV